MTDSKTFFKKLSSALNEWESTTLKERLNNWEPARFHVYSGALPKETKKRFETRSGDFYVDRLYTPVSLRNMDYEEEIGFPGQYPYTRGRDPLGYRAWEWPLYFYTGYGNAEDTNARLQELYCAGSRDIDLAFDLPTQLGYGCLHPLSYNEVGKVGVALDLADDIVRTFSGLPIENMHIGTVGNCIGPWALAMFYVLGERTGVSANDMRVWIQNDPLKDYNGRGTCIFPLFPAMDLCIDVIEYVCQHLPTWEPQWICTSMVRWGGATATQEIGFGIANMIYYMEAAAKRGIKLEDLVPKVNLHLTTDMDILEEAAKFRATRRLWARIAKERFKTNDPRILGLRITSVTSGYTLTPQQPLNNIIRLTAEVLASIFGGVEHMVCMAYDEALALPTMESTILSSLIKVILHNECCVGNTVDPLGGSYYLEHLTNELEEKGRYWFDKVEDLGGAVEATQQGYYSKQIIKGMYEQKKEIEKGDRIIIGRNKYVLDEGAIPIQIFTSPSGSEKQHVKNVKKSLRRRNSQKVETALGELSHVLDKKGTRRAVNIVPAMINAVRNDVTIGEIFDLMRGSLGEYRHEEAI